MGIIIKGMMDAVIQHSSMVMPIVMATCRQITRSATGGSQSPSSFAIRGLCFLSCRPSSAFRMGQYRENGWCRGDGE